MRLPYQKSYQRQRLEAIKLIWDGCKIIEAREKLGISKETMNKWIDLYLAGGFALLLKPKHSGKTGSGQLVGNQLRVFKDIILNKHPEDYEQYELEGYVWTLGHMKILLKKKCPDPSGLN